MCFEVSCLTLECPDFKGVTYIAGYFCIVKSYIFVLWVILRHYPKLYEYYEMLKWVVHMKITPLCCIFIPDFRHNKLIPPHRASWSVL